MRLLSKSDCLCETGRAFSKLVPDMFNKHVPYDQIHYFEPDRSFDLNADQYERLMLRGHEPEILLSYDEKAADVLLGVGFRE